MVKYGLYGIDQNMVGFMPYDSFAENNTELHKTVSVFKGEVKLCPLRANVNCSVEYFCKYVQP